MIRRIYKYVSYFNLKAELESFSAIHSEIEKGIRFKGTNLWILICAILLASVGLNMNSTAVIIGAMLISPLMGPINGMGYGIATYDFDLFKSAFNNFVFAVIVSLLTSTIYFLITPVSTAHSELLARTNPTIYDVFIAFFGGVAGILAISSKLKGNVIPGVAIATALMPPICTAGYGLATMQLNFFFGSLYLFTINTVFIAVAAMIVCQVLKFPIRNSVDTKRSKSVKRLITIILLITIVPSIILGYKLVQEEKFVNNSNKFIKEISVVENSYLLERNVSVNSGSIGLIYSGYGISDQAVKSLKQKAISFNLDTSKITIARGSDENILRQQKQQMLSETEMLNNQLIMANYSLNENKQKMDSIVNIPLVGKSLLAEITQIYPRVKSCAYAETIIYSDSIRTNKRPMVVFEMHSGGIAPNDKIKITQWIKARLENDNVKVIFE